VVFGLLNLKVIELDFNACARALSVVPVAHSQFAGKDYSLALGKDFSSPFG
jgi:hypothetical protein